MKLAASIILLSLVSLLGCQPRQMSFDDLSQYIADEDNGLVKTVKIGSVSMQVVYQPTEIWVKRELASKHIKRGDIDEIRTKYDSYLYFLLSISNDGREALHQFSGTDYSDLVQTASFHMHEYVTLSTSSGDTLEVADFVLNRTYGLNASTDILFVFDKSRLHDPTWLQFNLKEFGIGIGHQQVRFEMSALENIPEVNL